jgi:hypothetical protein
LRATPGSPPPRVCRANRNFALISFAALDGLAVERHRTVTRDLLSAGHVVWQSISHLRRHRAHAVIRAHVLANRLQALQDALPLCPIELP